MVIGSYIIAFLIYLFIEYKIHKLSYSGEPKPSITFLPQWKKGKEWVLFISPGYLIARYYKNKISYFPCDRAQHCLRDFIRKNNLYNIYHCCPVKN